MRTIGKAREIYDAKIQFVSLVDAAANKRKFLVTKAQDGTMQFVNYGRILKADNGSHYVTGIVYEPMTEDTDGEFMTAEEIRKAAYYYIKNFERVDIQHSFEPDPSCAVVESWIAKADFSIGNEQVKEGTWLMTVEVTDDDLWNRIEKGQITGFSMGGICACSEEEVELNEVEKNEVTEETKNRGLLSKIAGLLGFDLIEKGDVAELYAERMNKDSFWNAFSSLEDTLRHYDPRTDGYVYETDEDIIRDALTDFDEIITNLLTSTRPLAKAIEGTKEVEEKTPQIDVSALHGLYKSLGSFIDTIENVHKDSGDQVETEDTHKEEEEVTKSEATEIIQKAVADALAKNTEPEEAPTQESQQTEPVEKAAEPEVITKELLEQMVSEAVEKAIEKAVKPEESVTAEDLSTMIAEEVEKAVDPIRKANHLPSNLNSAEKSAEKTEDHYLKGIL